MGRPSSKISPICQGQAARGDHRGSLLLENSARSLLLSGCAPCRLPEAPGIKIARQYQCFLHLAEEAPLLHQIHVHINVPTLDVRTAAR